MNVCAPQVVDSPADVAEKADRIITMLPSSPNVIEVYTGPNGILKYANVQPTCHFAIFLCHFDAFLTTLSTFAQ